MSEAGVLSHRNLGGAGFGVAAMLFTCSLLAGSGALSAPPPNDMFQNAITLPSERVLKVEGSNVDATHEQINRGGLTTGERSHGGSEGAIWSGHSVWWSWLAPTNGIVTMDTTGSTFDTILAVYLGTRVGELALVTENADEPGTLNRSSKVVFPVTGGQTYRIAISGTYQQTATGSIVLNIQLDDHESITGRNVPLLASAANNDFLDRAVLVGTNWNTTVIGYNYSADNERRSQGGIVSGEVHAAVNGVPWLGRTLWWSWAAPASGRVVIDTHGSTAFNGSELDTQLLVYTGDDVVGAQPDTLTSIYPLAENDNASGIVRSSRVSFPVVAGQFYHIRADGSSASGRAGHIIVNIALASDSWIDGLPITKPMTAKNDDFEDRILLTGRSVSVMANNRSATHQVRSSGGVSSGEAVHHPAWSGRTLWWRWQTDSRDEVELSTEGSETDTILAVYTAERLDDLRIPARKVGVNDDEGELLGTSRLRFTPVPQQAYQIVVDSKAGSPAGLIFLHIRQRITKPVGAADIYPAVEIELNSEPGVVYQLERAPDLTNWSVEGAPITGVGGPMRILVPGLRRAHDSFRFVQLSP